MAQSTHEFMFVCAFLAKQFILGRIEIMNLCACRVCHCLCVVDFVQLCHAIARDACVDCEIEIV